MNTILPVTIGRGLILLPPKQAEANLGSCLGIAVAWPEENRFALIHCLLPDRDKHPTDNRYFRYASSAPSFLLKRMGVPADRVRELRAIVAGGSDMYNSKKGGVGGQNIKFGIAALRALRIRILGRDVGGSLPRKIRLDAATGLVTATQLDVVNGSKEKTWHLMI